MQVAHDPSTPALKFLNALQLFVSLEFLLPISIAMNKVYFVCLTLVSVICTLIEKKEERMKEEKERDHEDTRR